MRLPEFIRHAADAIVDEVADFTRSSIASAEHLPPAELRNDSKKLLLSIADDMDAEQSARDSHEKSQGRLSHNSPGVTQSARDDAGERLRQGFTLMDLLAEYRALRANVVRRWLAELDGQDRAKVQELVRFDEAVDQAITEAVRWYTQQLEESRNLLLGVLGHDLRNPLGAIRLSADYLVLAGGLAPTGEKAARRIQSSAGRMRQMVDDLLDVTRTRMGDALTIEPRAANMAEVCRDTVEELEAFHPDRRIRQRVSGDMNGEWDVHRVAQLVSNLVSNAIQHGREDRDVTVSLQGEPDAVHLRVHNDGPPIAEQDRSSLGDPHSRRATQDGGRSEGSSGLGLGLYIVREVARAHGGDMAIESSAEDGTTFVVNLPRVSAKAPA